MTIPELVNKTLKLFAPPPRDEWPTLEDAQKPEVKDNAQQDK